jgi:dTDP-4-dehydrorhamnose reductase
MAYKILVVGAGGQVGQAMQHVAAQRTDIIFAARQDADITNKQSLLAALQKWKPDIISCQGREL